MHGGDKAIVVNLTLAVASHVVLLQFVFPPDIKRVIYVITIGQTWWTLW